MGSVRYRCACGCDTGLMREPGEPGSRRLDPAHGSAREEVSQVDRWRTALVMALHAGDPARAGAIVREAARDLEPVLVLDEVLAPAMHEIGALWERNEISIADEHLATSMVHRLLAEVAPELRIAAPRTRSTVLLASPASERHGVGLQMAGDVLDGAGYVTYNLGTGVPPGSLADALRRHRPALVALSTTMPWPGELAEAIDQIRSVLPDAEVLIGGAAARTAPPALAAGLHIVPRLVDLLPAAETALARRGPSAG